MTKKIKFVTEPLKYDQTYYYWGPEDYYESSWGNGYYDFQRLRLYRIFLKKKYAKRADNFIKEFIRSNPEKLNYLTSAPDQGTKVWYGLNMNGDSDDPKSENFDINSKFHQKMLDNFRFYRTSEEVIKAGNLINLVLETEYKRQKYKFITEEPEPETKLYFIELSIMNKYDISFLFYDPNNPKHSRLLARGFLFLEKEDALRVATAMVKHINPLASQLPADSPLLEGILL